MGSPGTIGILGGDLARYSDFSMALCHLMKPDGARLLWTKSMDVVGNMNTMCRNVRGDWLWVLGDDHVFDPDLLVRLLAHDVDVVVPLCLKRSPPYAPVVFSGQDENGDHVGYFDLPAEGLVPIHAAGSAGMLIRRHVLDALADPVFETDGGGMNEDLVFCRKVRDAGFQIWCDVEAPIGHIGHVSVWPTYDLDEGEWKIALDLGNGVVMPLRRFLKDPEPVAA